MHLSLTFAAVGCFASVALAIGDPPPASAPEAPPAATTPASPSRPLPPDEAAATKALADSPRHGEWMTISLGPDAGGKVEGLKSWISYPERADKAPVVIVIHEIFGMTDWVRSVADQLAAEGFIAVAPDLLTGKGPNGGDSDSFTNAQGGDTARDAIRKLDPNEVVRRLKAASEWATAMPAATSNVGCVGFCWGGTTAWTYATKAPGLKAAVVYYGTAPDSKEAIAAIAAPVLGQYGGDDARVTSTVEKTKSLVTESGKRFDSRVYEGAGHGFLRQQSGRDGKNRTAAQAAWDSTIAFLKKELESAPSPEDKPAHKPSEQKPTERKPDAKPSPT